MTEREREEVDKKPVRAANDIYNIYVQQTQVRFAIKLQTI